MKRIVPFILAILTVCTFGCGNSDNFVFTNTNNNTGPTPGVPTQLAFVQNPAQTTNTDFSTPPVVEVQDAFGDRVPGATNTITVSLVNPGTAVLNGQTTRDAVDGRATFTGLSVSEAGTFTLTCSAQGLTSANSATFTVTPSLALYGLASVRGDGDPVQLIQLDPDTGEYVGTLGFLEAPNTLFFNDLQCLPDGTVYAIGFDAGSGSNLIEVNMSIPSASTNLGTVTGVDFLYSLAYDANNEILYAIAEEAGGEELLCTINTTTLVATPAANDFGGTTGGLGLAFDNSTSTLYLADGDSLYTIDPATGNRTLINGGGTIGIAVPASGNAGIRGLDFNPQSNQLFGVSRGNANSDTNAAAAAGSINTTTGASTLTGLSPENAGLAYCENPTVPAAGPARQTGYTVSGITQAFIDISGTGTALGLTDDGNSTEAIGFTFNFDGTNYTNVTVDANGYVSFDDTNGETEPELIPTDVLNDDTLMVFWDDLDSEDPAINGDIYVQTLGTSPNRRFVIQYETNHDADLPGTINCEVILYEGTNIIEFHYDDVTFGDAEFDAGQSAVVGIQTDSTTADIWSIFQPVLTNTTAIRFTP